jgi:hypothetical protein
MMGNDMPRRACVEKRTPLENVCVAGIRAMEVAGAHPLLTEAQRKLIEAQNLVADWIDQGALGASGEWVSEAGPWRPNYYDYGFWGGFQFVDQAVPLRPYVRHKWNEGRPGYGQQCIFCGAVASVSITTAGERGGSYNEECPRHPRLADAEAFDRQWKGHPALAAQDQSGDSNVR